MKNLTKIILTGLAGSLLLAGCNNQKSQATLTEESFKKAVWAEAPYHGQVWSSYKGENVTQLTVNWKTYCEQVAQANGAKCVERDKEMYFIGFRRNTISLPDLNEDRSVISGKDTVRIARANSDSPNPIYR